jgi:threonine synthase
MFSLQDANIHNIAIEGVFDDCQDIVKAVSNDHAFKAKYKIGTVNSINWARLLAQVVYYFAGYLQATRATTRRSASPCPAATSATSAPAMWRARWACRSPSWWWPPTRTTCSTSSSAPASTGARQRHHETSSPSMDISKASNFERFVFDLLGRDGGHARAVRRRRGRRAAST